MSRTVTAEEAVAVIKSGARVFIHSVAAAPSRLIEAMTARASELRVVEIVSLHTEGPAPYAAPEMAKSFRVNALFVGANVRRAVEEGRADYLPVFLSEVPSLFRSGILPLDVALIHVSPPDHHGYCSLGVSVDVSRAAVQTARTVIAQVNPRMPRSLGDGLIHEDQIDYMVEVDEPIPELAPHVLSAEERAIGRHCAELVDDGATLQIGHRRHPRRHARGARRPPPARHPHRDVLRRRGRPRREGRHHRRGEAVHPAGSSRASPSARSGSTTSSTTTRSWPCSTWPT